MLSQRYCRIIIIGCNNPITNHHFVHHKTLELTVENFFWAKDKAIIKVLG